MGEVVSDISADHRLVSFISQVGAPGGGVLPRLAVLEVGTELIRLTAEAPQGPIQS